MQIDESLDTALGRAGQTEANRRAVVAIIDGANVRWWGGNINQWSPDVTQLSSQASLNAYQNLVKTFKAGRKPVAHAVMIYKNGTFASVMLGVRTKAETDEYLTEAMGIVQSRSPQSAQSWLKV